MPLFDELALLDYSDQFALELERLQQQFQDASCLGTAAQLHSSALHRLRVPFVSWFLVVVGAPARRRLLPRQSSDARPPRRSPTAHTTPRQHKRRRPRACLRPSQASRRSTRLPQPHPPRIF